MSRSKRLVALALCVAAVLVMSVSVGFMAFEAAHGHDCIGSNCPICAFIAHMVQLRHCLFAAVLTLLLAQFGALLSRRFTSSADPLPAAFSTLVGVKIRLND